MVFSGLTIILPNINEVVPNAPETATIARAGDPLGPGPGPAHQDGRAGDGSDILIIYEYMSYTARHQHPSYGNGWDYYYVGLGTMVDDLHYFGYTVDCWYNYYYAGGYGPGRRIRGTYDNEWRYTYYPVDSKGYPDTIDSYNDYKMVIIMGYSSMWTFGCYNYGGSYESARPVTAERTLTGLEDYAANGGSIYLAGYYTPYYLFYTPYYVGNSAVQSSFKTRMSALFDCTNGYYYQSYGYGSRGLEGETDGGNPSVGVSSRDYSDLWGSSRTGTQSSGNGGLVDVSQGDTFEAVYHSVRNPFPDAYSGYSTYRNYQYLYYQQRPINGALKACEHSYSYGYASNAWMYNMPNTIQSDHGGEFKTVYCMSHHTTGTSYYRHSSGSYRYGAGRMEQNRIPFLGSILDYMVGGDAPPSKPVPDVYVNELQDTGNEDEWFEVSNTIKAPCDLNNLGVSLEGATGRKPTTWFADQEDLGGYGTPADLTSHTYYLNAESLYIDNYYTDMYLYKTGSEMVYTTNYNGNNHWTVWYDESDDEFIDETERNGRTLGELQDVYQFTLADILMVDTQYARLNGDYETDCTIYNYNPGGSVKVLDYANDVDLDTYVGGFQSAALPDIQRTTYLYTAGKSLYITSDPDVAPYFWTVQFPKVTFVNDNHYSSEHRYYSHADGREKFAGGAGIVDIYFPDNLNHYTNPEYFEDTPKSYGGYEIDYTDGGIRSQITWKTVAGPILTDMIHIHKNNGRFYAASGTDIVDIPIDLGDEAWLWPLGSTYNDYTDIVGGNPRVKALPDTFVVEDISDSEDELETNGILYIWNHTNGTEPIAQFGWGTSGMAPEPVTGLTTQAYFDGTKYNYAQWSLGAATKGAANNVAAPAYGSTSVVINEINPSYIELYNRGGTTIGINGWKLTGESSSKTLSGTLAPGAFQVVSFPTPFKYPTGGRVSLLDELGTMVSSIGYTQDVGAEGDTLSYVARHIDGIGVDYGFNDTQLQPSLADPTAQANMDWDVLPGRTPNYMNYDGITILQCGEKDKHYSLVENLTNYNPDWTEGILGTKSINDYYLNNFDIIFVVGGLSTTTADVLDAYILSGGRLYAEYGDWSQLAAESFYTHIGAPSAVAGQVAVDMLYGTAPLTGGLTMDYTGNVNSRFVTNDETFTVWEEGGNTYSMMYVHIDVDDADNSYRVVASAAEYAKMSEAARGTMPWEYTGMIVDYFLDSDDEINHAPGVTLLEPVPDVEIPLTKTRPGLYWQNNDVDVWDKIDGAMKYTLYIDTDENKVINMDPDAISNSFVERPDKSTVVTAFDAPTAAIYYWGIFAQDKYAKTTYEYGGAFKFDDEVPAVDSLVAMSGAISDDPMPMVGDPDIRIYGPSYTNSKGQTVGRPDAFAVTLTDNFGLKFSNNHLAAERIYTNSFSLGPTVFSVRVSYYYAGQYGDTLPNFDFYVDMEMTDQDLEGLNGETEATFYMIPDAPIPDGEYTIYVVAADEVRWGSYMDYFFKVDLTAPDAPTNIGVTPETYVDQFGELYLKAGDTYTLSCNAPSATADDASMTRVVFQQAVSNYEGATWEDIGTDFDPSDNTYSVLWTPDTDHYYVRAIAYDEVDNFAISEVFVDFRVDGAAPEKPLTLLATLNLDFATPVAEVSGYVYDKIVEGQTSGVDYVILYVNGDPVRDEFGQIVHVPVVTYQFSYDVELGAIIEDDVAYEITAQAFDHVNNAGEMSGLAEWTNTGNQEDVRIISPSSIKDIPMTEMNDNPDDSQNELRGITVTFDTVEQDFANYLFIIREGQLRTSGDADALGLPDGVKFLSGYYYIEVPPTLTNFEARVTLEIHLSTTNNQFGLEMGELLERLRLVTRHEGENDWEVLTLLDGAPVATGEPGVYRLRATVNRFSEFAVIIAQTDLTVKNIIIGATPALPGQNLTITVTVHNGGDFPILAENVQVMLHAIDEDGAEEPVGMLDFGTIDPEHDYYPDDPTLKKGDKQATIRWEAKNVDVQSGSETWTIRAEVDPDGYLKETNELNNEKTQDMEFVAVTSSTPSFSMTFVLMALGALLVVGLSVYTRKKRE